MIRTADAYRAGLSDGRRVFYRGAAVKDVVSDPELRVAVDHSAIAFDLAHDPDLAIRSLAVDVVDGEECSAFYAVPRSAGDLSRRSRLIETAARRGSAMIVLKEVGSDALFGLLRTLGGPGLERAAAFHRRCQQDDLAVAVAQTDVKGDRSLPPHRQPDSDHYVHIVDEDSESIVVRGAKCHTSVTPNADELIVLPTRAMTGDDADYAVSFAIPIDTPGLSMYVSSYSAGARNAFEFPISSRHKMLETLTVFDDVVVPKERVFLCREPDQAGPLALAFVDYHRFTAISYKLPLLDLLVGAAFLVAEANGISRSGHVRDKLAQLIAFAETVRGLSQLAASRAEVDERGMARPDPLTVNMAKYTFAHGFSDAVASLIDLAGGLLVTGPGGEDWDSPEIRPVLEKYFAAAVPAEERLRIMHLVSDLTARDFGGYQAVLAAHAEGSLEAEKLQLLRSYDTGPAAAYARELARDLMAATTNVDVLTPAVYVDGPPHAQFAWLRANAPVYEHTLDDPNLIECCWVISRHDDVRAISRDPETFSSADGIHLRRKATHQTRPNMINMDDPEHQRIRKLVSGGFTPRVLRAFREHYGDLADQVAERALAGGGPFDGIRALAAELPLLAICEIAGAPVEDRFRIFEWSNVILSSEDPDYVPTPDAFQNAVLDLIGYAQELADKKRRAPGDDLISALLGPDGRLPLTDEEYEGLVLLLLAAGNETTRSAIAHGLLAFAEHPDQWAALRDDPDGLDTAVEEVIRWASPVNYMARTATRDVELHGQVIGKGDKVVLLYSSANRDEAVFEDPDRFDVRRSPNHHLGFGFGPHFCLGATLARIELRAIFEVLIPRVSRFELAGPPVRARSSFLNAIKELPLRASCS